MRVVTWNCNRAHNPSALWDHFLSLDADVALLQEVGALPTRVSDVYSHRQAVPVTKEGSNQSFRSVLLTRGTLGRPIDIRSRLEWVNNELDHFSGNVFGNEICLENGSRLDVILVHSPAWPLHKTRWQDQDFKEVKLTLNRDVWVADLLWHALLSDDGLIERTLIVGGDFNLSETFDSWKGGPRGNKEYLDRMTSLGLTECLRRHHGRLVPTFKNLKGGSITAQIDHLFVTPRLAERLVSCVTGDPLVVFGRDRTQQLSDHLPIVADFD